MTRTPVRLLAASLVALFVTACAQSNGDVNRVQPNYTRKADLLDGVWYFRNTVTGASANTGFTFTGETGLMEKVVFEVNEDFLTAYRSYPMIVGTDRETVHPDSRPTGTTTRICHGDPTVAANCTGGKPYYGSPIAQYRIRSHFDIQRTYNAATGETSNVIVENTSDRPWNQREYIRVDWNQSLSNAGDSMMWNTVQNPSRGTDFNAWIQPNEPGTDSYDWPVREYTRDAAGEDRLTYMDFTGRYYARPFEDYIPGYERFGKFPVCYVRWQFYPSNYKYDCTSQEIRMRTSLAKVDPVQNNDYEPLIYDNDAMKKFGYFRTERLTYDRGFGVTQSGRIFLANRFRTWNESYRKDAQGQPDKNQVIPFAQRTPKPIVYYVSPAERMGTQRVYEQYLAAARGMQWSTEQNKWVKTLDLYGRPVRGLEEGWDLAFRRATAAAQGKNVADVPKMLYVCENPVPTNDSLTGEKLSDEVIKHCGQPGFSPKFGDVRYSFLYTITEPTPNGLLGYGPSSADPETGEIISANANTYTGAVDTQSQYAVDVVDLLKGGRSIDEHIKGEDVLRYFMNNPAYANPMKNQSGAISAALGSVEDRGEQMQPAWTNPSDRLSGLVARLGASGGLPEHKTDALRSAAGKIAQRPDLEALLIDNPEMSNDVLGLLPAPIALAASENPTLYRDAARQLLLNMDELYKHEQARIDWASRKNIFLAEFTDRPMFALAQREANEREARVGDLMSGAPGRAPLSEVQAYNQANQELRERVQQRVWRATSEHEIGHTFGLRHNFQGSFDALNFFDPYWDLKQDTLTVCATGSAVASQTSVCAISPTASGKKIIPGTPADLKAASDGTLDQLEQGIFEHEYSSIMDYGGKVNADFQGIGKYDEAAILFAYSGGREPGYVEVFDSGARTTPITVKTSAGTDLVVPGAGYAMPIITSSHTNTAVPNYTERFHYSLLPIHFGEGSPNNLDDLMTDGIAKMRSRTVMKWSEVRDAQAGLREILKTNAAPPAGVVADVPMEVPYMFCTDDHVGSVLSCNRFDRGADYYEMNRQYLEDYWNGYFFTHFKRDRYNFNDDRAFSRAYGTFNGTGNIYKQWVYNLYQQTSPLSQGTQSYRTGPFSFDPLMFATWTMGVFDGFNHMLRVSQVPPAGYYARIVTDGNLDGTIDDGDIVGSIVGANDQRDYTRAWRNISNGDEFDNLTAAGISAVEDLYDGAYRSANVSPALTRPYADSFANLPRGEARRIFSRYDFKSGFAFQNRMVEVGHYNDQIGAMFATISARTDFLGVDDVADQRRFNIPYYLVFKNELSDIFGGMWAQDETKVRPIASLETDRQGTVILPRRLKLDFLQKVNANDFFPGFVYPEVTKNLSDFPSNVRAAPADITLTWTSRFYGLYLGIATFNINFDADFAKSVQVFKLGGGEQFQVADGFTEYRVEDIATGAVYVAVQPTTATSDSPAVRMLKEALKYKRIYDDPNLVLSEQERTDPRIVAETKQSYLEAFQGEIRDLDIMRGFYSIFGQVL